MVLLDIDVKGLTTLVTKIIDGKSIEGANLIPLLETAVATLQNIVTLNAVRTPNLKQYEALQQQRDDMKLLKDSAENIVAELQKENRELSQDLREVTRALARRTDTPAAGSKPDKPEPFKGDRNMLRPFVAQLRLYTSTLPDDQTRLRTAVFFLRDLAFDQIHLYIRDTHVDLANLSALITILKTAFDNSNWVREAESKLNNIQQGTRDFVTYHAEFQRYAEEVF